MNLNKLTIFNKDKFVLYTCIMSTLLALLYLWKGFQTQFFIGGWIIISLNIIYVPVAIFFKKDGFSYFHLIYSVVLVFILAFDKTFLYNNYTALFVICIVIMIKPKIEIPALVLYFSAVCVSFAINEEKIYHFFIHIARSFWFIEIVMYVLNDKFNRKKLILYNDEKQILDQLCSGKIYQKEVTGFSENTVYRKLKAARERNGNITRDQLVELYRKEKEPN